MDYGDPRSKDQSQTVHNICAPIFFVCLSIDYGGTIKKNHSSCLVYQTNFSYSRYRTWSLREYYLT